MARTKTAYVRLTEDDWKDIKETATTLTGYDPEQSGIKGQTTVQLMKQTTEQISNALGDIPSDPATASNILTDVHRTLMQLMRREAYNRVIGEQKRDKMAAAQKSA